MAYPRTIRNFNCFVDGVGYFGLCAKAVLPELSMKTEEFRAGGMDGPVAVDMGVEAMEAELEFHEFSPALLKTFGRRLGVTLRAGALGEDDFEADSLVFTLGGRFTQTKGGDLGAGDRVPLTLMLAVDRLRVDHNGETVIDVDIRNGRRVIGGEDQMLAMRAALAI